MKKSCLLQAGLALFCMLLVYSCKKNDTCFPYIPPEIANTKIARYYSNLYGDIDSLKLVGTINYDKKGNPASIIKTINSTGNPDVFFHYDKNGRLSDYIGAYSNPDHFEFWHFLVYDNKDRVVVDSTYALGSVVNGRPQGFLTSVASLLYDASDRVVKHTVKTPGGMLIFEENFAYDANGNRNGATTSYDSKLNPRLLNKVWQFLDLDYSVNNSLSDMSGLQYSSKGFLSYFEVQNYSFTFLGQGFGSKVKIEYK